MTIQVAVPIVIPPFIFHCFYVKIGGEKAGGYPTFPCREPLTFAPGAPFGSFLLFTASHEEHRGCYELDDGRKERNPIFHFLTLSEGVSLTF